MIKHMAKHSDSFLTFLKKWRVVLISLFSGSVTVVIVLVIACYLVVGKNQKYVIAENNIQHIEIGLVLGAGISDSGRPYDELRARLDKAADALNSHEVSKLILSGDNRFHNYDEPTAMLNYLVQQRNIPENQLQRDFAGRSTYESCERAAKVFGVKQLVIFSAESHLPRAIYLCRHFGIEAVGISSGVEANNSGRREPLARVKAIYNTHLAGEPTVLGAPISLY